MSVKVTLLLWKFILTEYVFKVSLFFKIFRLLCERKMISTHLYSPFLLQDLWYTFIFHLVQTTLRINQFCGSKHSTLSVTGLMEWDTEYFVFYFILVILTFICFFLFIQSEKYLNVQRYFFNFVVQNYAFEYFFSFKKVYVIYAIAYKNRSKTVYYHKNSDLKCNFDDISLP